jgi:colanic acid/amylovoran biosynthesis glycosyltransferase
MQTSIHADDGDCEGGFPVIISDMMATDMPVIGSTHCDIPEIIKHGRNGLLAEEGSVESTTECILDLQEHYNEYCELWIAYNNQFLRDNFDAMGCALRREALYEKCCVTKAFC